MPTLLQVTLHIVHYIMRQIVASCPYAWTGSILIEIGNGLLIEGQEFAEDQINGYVSSILFFVAHVF
jgi:hypothetical protein